MANEFNIQTIVSMPFEENTYVVWRPERTEAVVIDPGLEPGLIVEFLRGIRDVAGPVEGGPPFEHVRVRASGKVADLVANFTMQSGRVRMIYQGLYERQPDGSVLLGVDHFAFRDAAG